MKPLFFDVETTAKPLHDPFNPTAKLCYIGADDGNYTDYAIEYFDVPYYDRLVSFQKRVDSCDLLVGANPKFDLTWGRRYGVVFTGKLVWDVLLVQFILDHQTTPLNSLNDVAVRWGLRGKLDVVKTEYWDKGRQTMEVPEQILRDYLRQDVQLTKQIFYLQYDAVVERGILPLVTLHNQDLRMLAEMEWNGNLYDVMGSEKKAMLLGSDIEATIKYLNTCAPVAPRCWSNDFISQLLYGGTYKEVVKEPYLFTYKDGSTKEKLHNVIHERVLPQLVAHPKKGLKKEGFWPTDEATLKKLKTTGIATKIVQYILELRRLEKLVGTYLSGFPSRIKESGWEGNLIHTNYNQAMAVTGRLSSVKPNVQNNPDEQKPYFISRFE